MTDEWAKAVFWGARYIWWELLANCPTNIVTGCYTTAKPTAKLHHRQALGKLIHDLWGVCVQRLGKDMQSIQYRFVLSFLANLSTSFSSDILLACHGNGQKRKTLLYLLRYIGPVSLFQHWGRRISTTTFLRKGTAFEKRERRVAKQSLNRLGERKSNWWHGVPRYRPGFMVN